MTQTIQEPLQEGTRVRIAEQSLSGDPELDPGAPVGHEFTVYSYCPPGEGDDPQGRPYYLLDTESTIGGADWCYPEHLEVLMTAEQMRARCCVSGRS